MPDANCFCTQKNGWVWACCKQGYSWSTHACSYWKLVCGCQRCVLAEAAYKCFDVLSNIDRSCRNFCFGTYDVYHFMKKIDPHLNILWRKLIHADGTQQQSLVSCIRHSLHNDIVTISDALSTFLSNRFFAWWQQHLSAGYDQSVSFGVAVLVHGNGTSQAVLCHLQSVSPVANKVV